MITAHFILGDRLHDSIHYSRDDMHDGLSPAAIIGIVSIAYICTSCGNLWARLAHETDEPTVKIEWTAHLRRCPKCGGGALLGKLAQRMSTVTLCTKFPKAFLDHELTYRQKGTYHD